MISTKSPRTEFANVTQDCVSKIDQYLPLRFKFHPCNNVSNMFQIILNVLDTNALEMLASKAYFSISRSFYMPILRDTDLTEQH